MRKRSNSNRANWSEQLKVLLDNISAMPPGADREAAMRRAQQLESAIHMDGWLRSSELRPPTKET